MSKTRIYAIGIGWFFFSLMSSALNDVIAKYTGTNLGAMQITFLRCLFGFITLIPFVLYHGVHTIKTNHPFVQIFRGVLLFLGIGSWIFSLGVVPITTATAISFSIPLFVLVFAYFFLDEKIIWQRWVATIIGFVGIMLTLHVHESDFNIQSLILVFAAVSFASLDIINKKFVVKESMLCMLFYSALVTTLLALAPALADWHQPSMQQLALLFVLGCSSNLILFFLLKAFSLVDATAVAPYRYFELAISGAGAYLVFGEVPHTSTMYGVAVLIPTTLFIAWSESKNKNN